VIRPIAATGISRATSITSASKSSVNPLPSRAEETPVNVRVGLAVDPRDPRHDVGAVLEEVEVAPALLVRVVGRAEGLALGAGGPTPASETEPDLYRAASFRLRVEGHRLDLPGRGETQCRFEGLDGNLPRTLSKDTNVLPLPTKNGEEPSSRLR
jgi:hypothetical protein